MEEIAHLFPWAGGRAGILAAQGFVQIGQTFLCLSVALMQLDERPRQPRRIRSRQLHIRQRQHIALEHRIRQDFAHVTDQPFAIPTRQFGDIQPELGRQRQHDSGADRTVIILHLVQVRERHAKPRGEFFLGVGQFGAQLA